MKIYLAGPLFTLAERQFNISLAEFLTAAKHDVWLPQQKEPRKETLTSTWESGVFEIDVEGVDWADVVVANMDGPDPDSGTAWEVGYAYGKDKYIVLFRTDFRAASDGSAPYNIMLSESADKCVTISCLINTRIEDLAVAVNGALSELKE